MVTRQLLTSLTLGFGFALLSLQLLAGISFGTVKAANSSLPDLTPQALLTSTCGFSDSFEAGTLSDYWVVATTNEGRVQISSTYTHTGGYAVLLDDRINNSTTSSATLILTVNLSGTINPKRLNFWWRNFTPTSTPQDGVFMSDDDGANWYRIFPFQGPPSGFHGQMINLDKQALAYGLTLHDHVKIKFQFFGRSSIPTAGYVLDDVQVTCDPNIPPELRNYNPTPQATDIWLEQSLRWQGSDVEGDFVTYTLAFDHNSETLVESKNVQSPFYPPALLNYSTTYYWIITASDSISLTSSGLLSFTTIPTQPNTVDQHEKISDTEGNFNGILDNSDTFGYSMTDLGDLDSDSIPDLAVGALTDDDGGPNRGAVWILLLNANGTVKSQQKISAQEGGFTGILNDEDRFGSSVTRVDDLDGDNVPDLAVGAAEDNEGGSDQGAIWILFMNPAGTVKSQQKISATQGNFSGDLDPQDRFGRSVAQLGDLNGDNVPDLAVGADGDDDGGHAYAGAVWILFLNPNGTVKDQQKISATQGNFLGVLDNYAGFGDAVAAVGDVDKDGVTDLAVGAGSPRCTGCGAEEVWILFLNVNGTVKDQQKISATEGNFAGYLYIEHDFGRSLAAPGDLNNDSIPDLIAGVEGDDDGNYTSTMHDSGAVWVLLLNSDGTVKDQQKISPHYGNFTGQLDPSDYFGCSVASPGDLNGDATPDLAVGACGDDDGGNNRGAVWILFLDPAIGNSGPGPANHAPELSNPTIVSGATDVPVNTTFGWEATDLDNDPLTYTLILDTSEPPTAVVANNLTTTTYTPDLLAYGLTYYWQVTATDGMSVAASPVWSFTTVVTQTASPISLYLPIIVKP